MPIKEISSMLNKAQMTAINARNVDSASEDIVKYNLVKRLFGEYTYKNKQLW